MSLKGLIAPVISNWITSDARLASARRKAEAARQRAGAPHTVTAFLRLDDPISWTLAEALEELRQRFDVELRVRLVDVMPDEMYPEPAMFAQLALGDAAALIRLYEFELPAPRVLPAKAEARKAARHVLGARNDLARLERFRTTVRALMQGALPPTGNDAEDIVVHAQMEAANQELLRLGHYYAGTVHYGGEWYLGVDRLDHLERRLIDLGAAKGAPRVRYDLTWKPLDVPPSFRADPAKPLVMFFSVRSPYTYVAFDRTVALAERYSIALQLRPMLPMLMRGLKVPPKKSSYILSDTTREARKLGVPFGRICDPLGAAVERCYALAELATEQNRTVALFSSFMKGVWAEGIDGTSDSGMRRMTDRAGLDWSRVAPLLKGAHAADAPWRAWEAVNRAALTASGLWGAPSYCYGTLRTWGQDRLWLLERAFRGEAAS